MRERQKSKVYDSGPWNVARPSLVYQHIFDSCAVELHRARGQVGILASGPLFAVELLRRLDGCKTLLIPIGDWPLPSVCAGPTSVMEIKPGVANRVEAPTEGTAISVGVWAEPDQKSAERVLEYIQKVLLPDGTLYIVTSGWLARFLPEWNKHRERPVDHPAGSRRIAIWLRQHGFTIESSYGFHGFKSIFWAYVSRLMERLGRDDLADRCHYGMRAKYAVSGWRDGWAAVTVVVAKRQPPKY